MSYIPSNAMPHAVDSETFEENQPQSRTQRVRELVRERPKTSAAAGAALIAGLAAAAVVPFLAARNRKQEASTGTGTKTSRTRKTAAKNGTSKRRPAAKGSTRTQ